MIPTLSGVVAIPFIVHPIDNAVHLLLNNTLRPYMRAVICDGAGGRSMGLDICLFPSDEGSVSEGPAGALLELSDSLPSSGRH
jgi:hypothetical protein